MRQEICSSVIRTSPEAAALLLAECASHTSTLSGRSGNSLSSANTSGDRDSPSLGLSLMSSSFILDPMDGMDEFERQ